jgi:tungstate transport system substrate-binding protein
MENRFMRRRMLWPLIVLPLLLWASFPARAATDKNIILATTTSTRDSGLLDVLLPVFEKKTGYVVKTVAVGTGKALAMGKRGDADVLMTHAPEAEKPLVQDGWLTQRVEFMYNDFVIVGPAADPARVAVAANAAEALDRVAKGTALFVSRGDNSGTHNKERSLWKSGGKAPAGDWYLESGQGMGATLRIASEKQAYTLTDRATYLHLQKTLSLKILLEGDPVLMNIYSVMLVNPARHAKVNDKGAARFHDWLLGTEAADLIRNYGKDQFGQPLFFLRRVKVNK